MNYRLFYSYQSDIHKDLNERFIEEAIKEAIKGIKSNKIKVIKGFRGTSGQKPLADTMLEQSKESDIFIGDITFTSKRSSHIDQRFFNLFDWEYFRRKSGQVKKSPNPNVLLETGYSWSAKDYDRTILVMNTAFGEPSELPVDMTHVRWPIKYSLSEEDILSEERKAEEFKKLVVSFRTAIIAAIRTCKTYQRDRFIPFKQDADWKSTDFKFSYIAIDEIKELINELRANLIIAGSPQRIYGPKGCGKTRLAKMLFGRIDSAIKRDDRIESVLYYHDGSKYHESIEKIVHKIKHLNQDHILIIDNCPVKTHKLLVDELLDTNIRLLTISTQDDNDLYATIIIEDDLPRKVIDKILGSKFSQDAAIQLAIQTNGQISNALTYVNSQFKEEEINILEYAGKWRSILGDELIEQGALKLLEELSLFTRIGIDNFYKDQSEFILEQWGIGDRESLKDVVKELSKKSITKIAGDFVFLEAFIDNLADKRLTRLLDANATTYLETVLKYQLGKQFADRLVELAKLESTHKVVCNILVEEDHLINYEFLNTDQGAIIIKSLAEIEPHKTLHVLEKNFGAKTYQELSEFENGRRYLVWALERLVFREETFHGAARLLFKLAVAENEMAGNNATGQFNQLFQIYLPATEASLEDRIALISQLITADEEAGRPVIIAALDRALMVQGFIRMGGADKQAGETLVDYHPQLPEILEYWQSVIDHLFNLGQYDVLIRRFNEQIRKGNSEAMLVAAEKMIGHKGEISRDLRQQFEYLISNDAKVPSEIITRVKQLLLTYSQGTVREMLEFKVAHAPYSGYTISDGIRLYKSEEYAKSFAHELVQSNDESWLNDVDVLLQGEQRLTFSFGKSIALHKQNYLLFVNTVIEKLLVVPFDLQNNRLIEGYLSGIQDMAFIRFVIDQFLSKPEIAYHAIRMTSLLDVQLSDLNKLYPIIEDNPRYVAALQYIKLDGLEDQDIILFIEWLKNVEHYGWWCAISFLESYIDDDTPPIDTIRSLALTLLRYPGVFNSEYIYDQLLIHQYVELVKKLDSAALDNDTVVFLSEQIVEVCKDYNHIFDFYISDILYVLLENHWNKSWPILATALQSYDYYGGYQLADLLKKFSNYDVDKLIAWMDEYPDKSPQQVISIVNLLIYDDGSSSWTPIARQMIERYYHNEDFFMSLSSELHSYSWGGSPIPLLKSRKILVEELLSHPKVEVREFASREVAYFDREIHSAIRREENRSIR